MGRPDAAACCGGDIAANRRFPLPLLDHFGVGLSDETSEASDPSQRLAPPIAQLLDSHIDQLTEPPPSASSEPLLLFFMVDVAFLMVVVARPSLE